jgi:hypothetical protein
MFPPLPVPHGSKVYPFRTLPAPAPLPAPLPAPAPAPAHRDPVFHMNQHVFIGTQPYEIIGKLNDDNYVLRSIAGGGGNVYSTAEYITTEPLKGFMFPPQPVPFGSKVYPFRTLPTPSPLPAPAPAPAPGPLPNEEKRHINYQQLERNTYQICLKRNEDGHFCLVTSLEGISKVEPLGSSEHLEEGNVSASLAGTEYYEDPEMLANYEENEMYAVFKRVEGDGPEAVSVFHLFYDKDTDLTDEIRLTINIDFDENAVVIVEVEQDRYSLKRIFESKFHTGVPYNEFEPFRFFSYQKLATITSVNPCECILTNGIRVPLFNVVGCYVGQKVIIQKESERYYFIRSADDPPLPPPILVRAPSGQTSDQRHEYSCGYHVLSKIMIKNVFKKFFALELTVEENRLIRDCADLFTTTDAEYFIHRESFTYGAMYRRAGRKGAVNIILFHLMYHMYHELRNPGISGAQGTESNLLAVLYYSILSPNYQGPLGFMGPIATCRRFNHFFPDPKVQQVAYTLLEELRTKVHEKFRFIQVRLPFSVVLNENENFHAVMRQLLTKDLYVSIDGRNKILGRDGRHGRHALLIVGIVGNSGRNYSIKNSWGETEPFSAPLTDVRPPDQVTHNYMTEFLDFLIPCTDKVFREVFSTLREIDPPTMDASHANAALDTRYGFYQATPEQFISTMTAYFPKYDEFSARLKGMDYQIARDGRRYKVMQSLGFSGPTTSIKLAFDELGDEPERSLTKAEKDAFDFQPERGGKRTRKYHRKRTLRKKIHKTHTRNKVYETGRGFIRR